MFVEMVITMTVITKVTAMKSFVSRFLLRDMEMKDA